MPAKNIKLSPLLFEDLGLRRAECAGLTAVVTGAGRGIGLQTARAFALLGVQVVLAEISEEGGKQAEAVIRAEGGEAYFVQTDVSRLEDVQRLARLTQEKYGAPHFLINNAIMCPFAPVLEMPEELFDQVLSVNLRGTFLMSKTFLPGMLARGNGFIANMVSTEAMPGLSAYIASKQGIAGFSQSLALEVGEKGVQVVAFGPGMVDTPGIRGVADRLAPELGLTERQFLGLSLHAGYEGLMPAEHAGAATAFLALRLGKEYQGQVVNAYEVLEKAGLLKTELPVGSETAVSQLAQPDAPDARRELVKRVSQIVDETAAEFEKLPIFVRPLARSGFKSKSGLSLEDWQRTLTRLEGSAEQFSSAEGRPLAARLEKLCDYYRGVPGETARFTRDQAMLQQISELCRQRIMVIQQLQQRISER
jgi:NAD(P)-dependent dehydrogenase (short-subunit alcohol dehydrogenase family)